MMAYPRNYPTPERGVLMVPKNGRIGDQIVSAHVNVYAILVEGVLCNGAGTAISGKVVYACLANGKLLRTEVPWKDVALIQFVPLYMERHLLPAWLEMERLLAAEQLERQQLEGGLS